MILEHYTIKTHYVQPSKDCHIKMCLNLLDDEASTCESFIGESTDFKIVHIQTGLEVEVPIKLGSGQYRLGQLAISALLSREDTVKLINQSVTAWYKEYAGIGLTKKFFDAVNWVTYSVFEMVSMIDYPGDYHNLCAIGATSTEMCVNNMRVYHRSLKLGDLGGYVKIVNTVYEYLRGKNIRNYITKVQARNLAETSIKLHEVALRYDQRNLQELSTILGRL